MEKEMERGKEKKKLLLYQMSKHCMLLQYDDMCNIFNIQRGIERGEEMIRIKG